MKPASLLAALLLLCAVMAVPAQAQTVVNPRTVEFDPSADHAAVTGGQPVVQRYDLQIFTLAGTTPYATGNLGKPAPQADGKIRVDFSTLVTPWPLADGTYDARVVAVGPTGAAASDVSNTFSFQSQSCTYTLGSQSQAFAAGGGPGSVTVTAGAGCAWTVVSDSTWVSLTTTSGTGSGPVNFTVTSNLGATARTATLTIGGKTFLITQAAPVVPCSYTLSTNAINFTNVGGLGTVTVNTTATCSWTATGAPTWVTYNTASGTGTGVASFNVSAHTGTTTRTASLTIAGQAVTVTQTAPVPCTYSISPASRTFGASAGSVSVAVTAGTGCAWTAASSDSWATLGSSGGVGNGGVTVNVTANGTTTARSSTLTIAGQPFAVTQSGIACTYTISPAAQNFGEAGGTGSFALSSLTGCGWTATSSTPTWLSVTNGSGSGGGTVTFSVARNPVASPRVGTISVGGQVFTVNQAAAVVCSYSLSGTGQNFTSGPGTGSVGVTAPSGCGWTATSSAATWLTVTSGSGNGNGTATFSVSANTLTSGRSATLTVGGQAYNVTQDALSCSFSVTPANASFEAAAGSGSVTVGGPSACGWTATNTAAWVTLGASSGNGGMSVPITVAPNPNATQRTASLTIAGQPFTVTQAGSACSYTLSPSASPQFPQNGGTGSVSVSCGSSCAWTASVPTDVTWVTVTTQSGSGAGTVTYTVAKNSNPTARQTTITVKDQTFTVKQDAANRPTAPKKPRITSVIGG